MSAPRVRSGGGPGVHRLTLSMLSAGTDAGPLPAGNGPDALPVLRPTVPGTCVFRAAPLPSRRSLLAARTEDGSRSTQRGQRRGPLPQRPNRALRCGRSSTPARYPAAVVPPADFAGLVAAVTGGASGIGLATARLLRDRGARVAVLDLGEAPDAGLLSVPCDVSRDDVVRAAVARVAGELGGLDVLVSNAGIGAVGTVEAGDDDEWARVLDVNVTGAARVIRAALPHLRASRAPSVVLTCSVVAFVGVPNRALYAASK